MTVKKISIYKLRILSIALRGSYVRGKNNKYRVRKVRKSSSDFVINKKKEIFLSALGSAKKKMFFLRKPKPWKGSLRTLRKGLINNRDNLKVSKKNRRIYDYHKRKRLKIKFFKKSAELLRENPLTRFYNGNLGILTMSYNSWLGFHTAIGNSAKTWINPTVFGNILAIRNEMILYDLSLTTVIVRKGLQNAFQISKNRGTVLVYASSEKYYKFRGNGFDHFLRTWLPGFLTNYKSVVKNFIQNIYNYQNLSRRQKKFLTSIDVALVKKLNYRFLKKLKNKRKGRIPAIPEFSFCLEDHPIWLNECHNNGLKTMAICDSDSFPALLDFPIVANQKSLPLSFFLIKLLKEAVAAGAQFDYFSFIGFNYISKKNIKN